MLIEYTPPKLEVLELLREKLACKPCEGEIVLAPASPEKVIERAAPGPAILAALAVHKHVDGLPLHRSQRIFALAGLDIAVQTLKRWEEYGHNRSAELARATHFRISRRKRGRSLAEDVLKNRLASVGFKSTKQNRDDFLAVPIETQDSAPCRPQPEARSSAWSKRSQGSTRPPLRRERTGAHNARQPFAAALTRQ